jgi:hypothetical protein
MMLSSNALIVMMAQIKGWMLTSEMDQFSAALSCCQNWWQIQQYD